MFGQFYDLFQIKSLPDISSLMLNQGSDNYYFILDKLFRWNFKYRVAQNFPVDIYFLVDPSYTMRNLRTQLADLADDIGL